ncbi:unnamed protein product [Schistocephalus solidus]|uniref:Uncharacterized protein n=1 Tax=Schistocephalus solidus TaxID=70667 RepID=A0A183TR79_SCHSO|nr:unnamed protein product [Schistocephalus solidus]
MANIIGARDFLEACYSCAGSINGHVDLGINFEGIRLRLTAPRLNATSTTSNLATRNPNDPPSPPPPAPPGTAVVPPPPSPSSQSNMTQLIQANGMSALSRQPL